LNRLMAKHIMYVIGLLFVVVASPRISLSVTAATIPKLRTWRRCTLSKIDVEYDLDEAIKSKGKVFVLFYASWCPLSRIFLPLFDKYAKENPQGCLRVKTDDKAKL
jgi:thiol-disulfide isomerase/thioredoxin